MTLHTASLSKTALRSGFAAFALTAVALGGMQLTMGAQAQAIAGHNSRAPLSVDAGNITADDRQNRVVASGGVIVTQAGLTVRSSRMLLNYTDAGSLDIQRITATGGVSVSRGGERASGDIAVYDFNRRIITMAGDVRLQRGGDTLTGGRLVIDLNTGISSVDGRASGGASSGSSDLPVSESANGRVRGTFSVPQN